MRVSVAIILMVLFLVEPLSAQRLPRARSRLSTVEAESATVEKAEPLKKISAKIEPKTSSNTTSTTASPPPPSPSPSPPPTSAATPASSKDSGNDTTSTTSVSPPVSSVHVRMAFSPGKKIQEERKTPAAKDDDLKSDTKPKKSPDTQDSPKEPPKKPSFTSTSTTTSTSTSKPSTTTKKAEQDEELRDALKKIHQEVLKQPRPQNKTSTTSTTTKPPTTKKPPKESDSGGLDTAETTYVRPATIHHHSTKTQESDSSAPLDAQASIQSTKFVLRDQGLQQLPSFVRSKDRPRPSTVRHILLQRSQQLADGGRDGGRDSGRDSGRDGGRGDILDETSPTSTTPYPHIPIVHFDKEQSADGSYKTSYETGNNIFAEETGFLKNPGVEDQEALVQQGSYSYTAPDGSLISVTYTADEMGFRAAGTHLPTPPPLPPQIQRSLDIIYAQIQRDQEEAAREAELERLGEASETHEDTLSPPTTGSKRESRRYLP